MRISAQPRAQKGHNETQSGNQTAFGTRFLLEQKLADAVILSAKKNAEFAKLPEKNGFVDYVAKTLSNLKEQLSVHNLNPQNHLGSNNRSLKILHIDFKKNLSDKIVASNEHYKTTQFTTLPDAADAVHRNYYLEIVLEDGSRSRVGFIDPDNEVRYSREEGYLSKKLEQAVEYNKNRLRRKGEINSFSQSNIEKRELANKINNQVRRKYSSLAKLFTPSTTSSSNRRPRVSVQPIRVFIQDGANPGTLI